MSASMMPHQAAMDTPSVIMKPWNCGRKLPATKTT
jgi:hypothetical protein